MRLDGYLAAARLAAGVPRFLRHRLDVAEARAIVERRRRSRGVDFLALARAAVYGHATSPYRALLAAAGCEYGDLAALVEREGLDTALAALLRAGVYVTVEELKGRRPIVRGSVVIEARPAAFENPALHRHDLVRTSGSRGGHRSDRHAAPTLRRAADRGAARRDPAKRCGRADHLRDDGSVQGR